MLAVMKVAAVLGALLEVEALEDEAGEAMAMVAGAARPATEERVAVTVGMLAARAASAAVAEGTAQVEMEMVGAEALGQAEGVD